jgi:hypothetical protein
MYDYIKHFSMMTAAAAAAAAATTITHMLGNLQGA